MCELLGMSANVPTDICFSFTGLIRRSGQTGPHKDGWGIAFYEGKGVRMFRDPQAGVHSEIARLVERYPIKSRIVISHIRRANRGRVCLENTHPFLRELWGRNWTFAHNGQLKGIKKRKLTHHQPIGTTDSEHGFCWMLDELRRAFPKAAPSDKQQVQVIGRLLSELNTCGISNVLLSNGTELYAFCSTRLYSITRKAPFGHAHLSDADLQVDFAKETSSSDVVTVIATRPLTKNEEWAPLAKGELKIFKDGLVRER